MQANNDSLIGKELRDKYRIDKLIAKGGQGSIYHATDISSSIDKEYVIKEFIPHYGNTYLLEVGSRLFSQESEILQKLGKHSQIPQIFDYFEADRKFYLVQELIEGENLEKELAEKQHLNETEAIALLKDILSVLNFVHLNKYIHRDIKPSNLIRSKYDRKIFLIDFGAVKEKIQLENIDKESNSDHTIAIETPGYMPREQEMGKPRFSSDIYAVGMVIIKALTGLNPQDLEYDDSNYNPRWRDRLPLKSQQYDPNFLNIIDKMVRNLYSDRYQSVREIIVDLDNSLGMTEVPREPVKEESNTTVILDSENNATRPQPQRKNTNLGLIVGGVVATTILITFGLSNFLQEKYVDYSKAEYGLKVELPEDWSIQENWMSLQPQVSFISPPGNDSVREEVIISIEDLATPLSLNQYTKQSVAEIELYNNIITPVQSTTFANKEGRKIVYQAKDSDRQQMQVWTIKNQKAYIATYIAETDSFDRHKKQAEKIIETLAVSDTSID